MSDYHRLLEHGARYELQLTSAKLQLRAELSGVPGEIETWVLFSEGDNLAFWVTPGGILAFAQVEGRDIDHIAFTPLVFCLSEPGELMRPATVSDLRRMSTNPAQPPRLWAKENNCNMSEYCALCGGWCEAKIGLSIFVEGTWDSVCDTCAEAAAPALFEAVCAWHQLQNARRGDSNGNLPKSLGGGSPFTQDPPAGLLNTMPGDDDHFDADFWREALG
jgi:hypothetical protein